MMLKVRVIPCLDFDGGRVVKGVHFTNLRDAGDPVECARLYTEGGADELCFLDITATVEKRQAMVKVIQEVACCCSIPLTVGGGIRTLKDMEMLFRSGADKIALNTKIVEHPELVGEAADRFGSQAVVASVDVKKDQEGIPRVYTHGGRKKTHLDARVHIRRLVEYGAGEILLTSMDRDGEKSGFDLSTLKEITKMVNVPVIASGGAGSPEDCCDAVLEGGAHAVLAASILHFKKYTIEDIKKVMQEKGIFVRLVV